MSRRPDGLLILDTGDAVYCTAGSYLLHIASSGYPKHDPMYREERLYRTFFSCRWFLVIATDTEVIKPLTEYEVREWASAHGILIDERCFRDPWANCPQLTHKSDDC